MDWQKTVVRKTIEGAGEYPSVQLQFLLQRLEQCPDSLPAIADAIRDMGEWLDKQADELEAEARRRAGGADVVKLDRKGGTA